MNEFAYEALMSRKEYIVNQQKAKRRSIIAVIMVGFFDVITFTNGYIYESLKGLIVGCIMFIFTYCIIISLIAAFSKPHFCDFGIVTNIRSSTRRDHYDDTDVTMMTHTTYSYSVSVNDNIYYNCQSVLDNETKKEFNAGDEVIIWQQGKTAPNIIKNEPISF